ncbi:MAG: diaminopimelate epimerase [Clostridia bacterium]|nr:diaminopimelate epimerase [Clostridia bacterium]
MKFEFTKMHGAGNDYIYFDCFKQTIEDPSALSIALSDRHFSIGGDGIVMICPSDIADAKMRMFNIDGSEGKMCGNAIRCVAKFLYEKDICKKESISIETLSGIKYLDLKIENDKVTGVTVDMGKAILKPSEIPVNIDGETAIAKQIVIDGKEYTATCVSMGNPHCVVFDEIDPDDIDLHCIGPKFEKNEIFPEQVNTEFVKVIDESTLKMRVWERGSGETLACGTGACATVVAAVENGFCKKGETVKVILTGGELFIRYTDEAVFMTGPAAIAFEGTVEY